MPLYSKTNPNSYIGRVSNDNLYLHEKVSCPDFASLTKSSEKCMALLGYACDEGVKRNDGRVGAVKGADAIRKQLGKLPNHLAHETALLDVGTLTCSHADLEATQKMLSEKVKNLLDSNIFPIILG